MKFKLTSILVAICIVGLATGFTNEYRSSAATDESQVMAMANWGDVPVTLEDLHRSADLIVRVRVVSASNRLLTQTLPIYGPPSYLAERAKEVPEDILLLEQGMRKRGISGTPDQLTPEQVQEILSETTLEVEQIGAEVMHTPFTDFTVEVQEVFKGKVGQEVVVMQPGGQMPTLNGPNALPSEREIALGFAENPLLKVGEEYVLYLTDSRDNETHAQGRELYVLVGPTGQFRIAGNQVHNPYSVHEGLQLPTTLDVLLEQLKLRAQ